MSPDARRLNLVCFLRPKTENTINLPQFTYCNGVLTRSAVGVSAPIFGGR